MLYRLNAQTGNIETYKVSQRVAIQEGLPFCRTKEEAYLAKGNLEHELDSVTPRGSFDTRQLEKDARLVQKKREEIYKRYCYNSPYYED